MKEIEVKILEINKTEVIKKLDSMGAVKTFEGLIEGIYFDFPDKRLCKENKTLRLRKKGTLCELTLKEKVSKIEAKIMNEYEVSVTAYKTMKVLLCGLGLQPYMTLTKQRISYAISEVHFEIDTFQHIPSFLEIEAKSIIELKHYVKKLGFSWKDAKPWSCKEVMAYYNGGNKF